MDPSSASKHYREKILDVLYILTGYKRSISNEDDVRLVLYVEERLQIYLNSIRNEALRRRKLTKKNAVKKANTITLKELYVALEDTCEGFGVKRCIILKRISRQPDGDSNDPDAMLRENDNDSVDELQKQLKSLDDGSYLFRMFERDRILEMKRADILTAMMSLEEYMEYKTIKTKFIQKPDLFDQWMGWGKMGPDLYIAFSWLCVNWIKEVLRWILAEHRRTRSGFLFDPDTITFDRMGGSQLSLHVSSLSTNITETMKNSESQWKDILCIDKQFRAPNRRTTKRKFGLLDFIGNHQHTSS